MPVLDGYPTAGADVQFQAASTFLERLGIEVRVVPGTSGFLPGVRLTGSTILVEAPEDRFVGDLLHEAGHLAVVPGRFRHLVDGDVDALAPFYSEWLDAHPDGLGRWPEEPTCRAILQSGESEAAAWSYAAAVAAGVDPMLPFSQGFDGQGRSIMQGLALGRHLGINGLVAGGMTRLRGPEAFPKMVRWLQL